ncbi:hypothetical protein MPH_09469 [Macrophomina phaseolina MS6]|uniref:Uncharacterized protein n=1 Tax=Macrophomina phaseolina (strain MS6) TaxID=1126212 RepID=K2RFR9_MACPH|nr:hypothetical protein MPH_09469 [Macrophomina phaseolina MS6]
MLQIRQIQHGQHLALPGDGHLVGAALPAAHAQFLVREALQLERLVRAPLEAGVGVEAAALLEEADERLDGPGEQNDEAAGREDEGEEEDGEVGVRGGEDALETGMSI